MAHFIKRGNTFSVADEQSLDIHKRLPLGCYVIKQDAFQNLFFECIDAFEPAPKLYGDVGKKADRVISTFLARDASTGILLNGEKGSGKTLMAKTLSIKCAELDIPTIVINDAWCGDKFNTLMQTIDQPIMLLFDEFEKVYDREEQQAVLTLMDGVFPSKKLFVMTCNDKYRIDEHMRNRPGRIFYAIEYEGLDTNFIIEYCNDNLNDKSHIDSICRISTAFHQFNFDMLKALVEEMNRYNESPYESLKMLNARPQRDDGSTYDVKLEVKGEVVQPVNYDPEIYHGNPLAVERIVIEQYGVHEGRDDASEYYNLFNRDMVKLDAKEGVIQYKSGDAIITFTKRKMYKFDYEAF